MMERFTMMETQPNTMHLGGGSPILDTHNQSNHFSSTKSSLAMVDSLINENNMFKHQKQYVTTELTKLRQISQSLLSQNIQLRSLYKQRTHDISKMINTFTIQTQESTDDYEHQQFLVKELNFGILKHIKLLMKEKEERTLRINDKSEEYTKLNLQKIRYEQQVVNKMKIKLTQNLNKKTIKEGELKQQQESDILNQLIEEVNQTLVANKDLCNKIYKYKLNPVRREQILREKEQIKTKLAFTLNQNQKYRKQIISDEQQLAKNQNQARNKLKKHTEIKSQLLEEVRTYQQANKNHQQLTETQVSLRKIIHQSKQQRQNYSIQLAELRGNREGLAYQINSLKKGLNNLKQDHFNKKIQLQCITQQKINIIRQTIVKNNLVADNQITKVKRDINKTSQLISSCEQTYKSLEEQIKQYSSAVGNLNNPIFDIERIEALMRLKRQR